MNQDFRAIYKNTGLLPRTLSEANKDATWSSPLTHHFDKESDLQQALEFAGGMIVGAIYIALAACVAVGILMFFGVVVIN